MLLLLLICPSVKVVIPRKLIPFVLFFLFLGCLKIEFTFDISRIACRSATSSLVSILVLKLI